MEAAGIRCDGTLWQKHLQFTRPSHSKRENFSMKILAPISLGELVDKITILEIKSTYVSGVSLQNVAYELTELTEVLNSLGASIDLDLVTQLKSTNQRLWNIENEIRAMESRSDFGEEFVGLARSVYHENDNRARLKQLINRRYGSSVIEEKLYTQYDS